jgi:hypothetical protein
MRKNSAAVALGRKGGLKGGLARAARLTPAQRSESASKAVRARWAKAGKAAASNRVAQGKRSGASAAPSVTDTSDQSLAALLKQLRATSDIAEVRSLSDKIERVIFHKQFENA